MPFDNRIVHTTLQHALAPTAEELATIHRSIQDNGLAVMRNFISREHAEQIAADATSTCAKGYGKGPGNRLDPVVSPTGREFRHPYLASRAATEYVTSKALEDILSPFLGEDHRIHNALFQLSFPLPSTALDFHIDCGSVKALNGSRKFDDFRLRTILYLSNVESGGFSYILDSHEEAKQVFLPLPDNELYPQNKLPPDPARRVTVHDPAGTLIVFNTHGLHRPEAPHSPRLVLNTWFARRDFGGSLPPVLFSLSIVPEHNRRRLSLFDSAQHFTLEEFQETPPDEISKPSIVRRVTQRILRNAVS